MTAVEGLLKTAQDVVLILKSSGLLEGEMLDNLNDALETDEIMFWHALAKNGGGNKETYLIWNVMPPSPIINVDSTKLRRGSALIDIFTRYNICDETIQELLERINNEALKFGWECELYEVPSYEPEFKRTRITLHLFKNIK